MQFDILAGHLHLGHGAFQKISVQFRHAFECGEEAPEAICFIFFIPQRSILLCRKPEDQPFGAVLVDWLLLQSVIQLLLRFKMCGWRGTALMLYAFRAICETVEQVGDTFVFLASDEASYITGVVLSVDGMART